MLLGFLFTLLFFLFLEAQAIMMPIARAFSKARLINKKPRKRYRVGGFCLPQGIFCFLHVSLFEILCFSVLDIAKNRSGALLEILHFGVFDSHYTKLSGKK